MEKNYTSVTLKIKGMTCTSCENRIERILKNTGGIANAMVSFGSQTAFVTYDADRISLPEIIKVIEKAGYEAKLSSNHLTGRKSAAASAGGAAGLLLILMAVSVILNHFGALNLFRNFPEAKAGMGYGMLFVIGLLTSAHCLAMCGGINLSQCVPSRAVSRGSGTFSTLRPSFLYNAGRVASYTVIGGIVGALGSVISFSAAGKGAVVIVAGVFMVIMGLNMMNLFPWLARFTPRMPKSFASAINEEKNRSGRPFYIGLFNGLMPCGPLQAMQFYALSTGSFLHGALSMMLFSLGTVPLMFGLGALSTVLTKKFAKRMMTVSAALMVLLGVLMFGNGLSLAGYALPMSLNSSALQSSNSGQSGASDSQNPKAELGDGIQNVSSTMNANAYEPIVVQKGIPVRWTLNVKSSDLNGCNGSIVIPEYNIEKKLEPGENVIEFTPDQSGVIPFSCWMGMIRSQITVVDDISHPGTVPQNQDSVNTNLPSCCGG